MGVEGAPEASYGSDAGSNTDTGTGHSDQSSGSGDSSGFNPAWNELLEVLPSSLHGVVKPHLQKWDQNFQSKTSEVQSRYAPYQQFVDNQVDPDSIEQAMGIYALLNADPQAFHTQMGEYYADQWGQGQEGETEDDAGSFAIGDDPDYDITQHPKFQELSQNQEAVTEFLAQQIQQEQAREAEAELDTEIEQLQGKYGEFDQNWVFSLAVAQQIPLEQAVQAYTQHVDSIRQAPRADANAPSVFSPSGGVPSQQPDPRKMDGKQTRSLVAEILAAQNR